MSKLFRFIIMAAVAVGTAQAASAGELKLSIANGRVTLTATDVPVRQILQEWTRVGGTTIVGGDKLAGQNVTLQLVDQPEREALEILLRSAAGYVASQRAQFVPTASVFDRIMILPTSRPPAYSASAPPPAAFSRPMPQPQPQPDDDEPVEPVPLQPQGPPGAGIAQQPGMPPSVPPGAGAPAQMPLTSKTPGMLPAAPNTPNPYAPPGAPPGAVPPNPNGRGGGPGGPGGPGGGPGRH